MIDSPQRANRDVSHDGLPVWMWMNVVSIDSVAVGLLWQFAFVVAYLGRAPESYELGIVGLSIWLVYTCDRLLDSLRIDCESPHSLRHRFHCENRALIASAWFVGLVIATGLVIVYASEDQLRWGFVAIALVCAYVVSVQFGKRMGDWFPKELRAGLVFAFGVSLTCWAEIGMDDMFSLACSTLLAAALFTTNCCSIALWERDLDVRQEFRSWAVNRALTRRGLAWALTLQFVLACLLMSVEMIPILMMVCLVAGDVLLGGLIVLEGRDSPGRRTVCHSPKLPVALADVALFVPPAVFLCIGSMLT